MAYKFDEVQKFINDNGLFFSDADLKLAQSNPDAGMTIANYKLDYKNATTDDQRALANAGANQTRKDYGGYTAGSAGDQFYLTSPSPQNYDYQQPGQSSFNYQQPGTSNNQQSLESGLIGPGMIAGDYVPPGAGAGSAEGGYGNAAGVTDSNKQNTNIGQYSDWQNPLQSLTNNSLDKIVNREEFVDPNAETLNNLYQSILNQEAYENPYAADLDNAYQTIMNQGGYESKYGDQQQALLDAILNQQEFSYDPESDASWQSTKKQYLREADRATQNMLGDMAGLTGGMASTAAISAASQAGDYYRGQMMDMLPQYEQQAYQRYLDGLANDKDKLSIINSMDEADYAKFMDAVNNNYNKFNTANQMSEQDYAKYRDSINDELNKYGIAKDVSDSNYQKYVDNLGFDYDEMSLINTLGQQMRDEFDTDRNFNYNQWMDELSYQTDKENTEYEREQAKEQQEYERNQYKTEYGDAINMDLAAQYYADYQETGNADSLKRARAIWEALYNQMNSQGGTE